MSANTTDSIGVFKCKVLEHYSSIQYSSHTQKLGIVALNARVLKLLHSKSRAICAAAVHSEPVLSPSAQRCRSTALVLKHELTAQLQPQPNLS